MKFEQLVKFALERGYTVCKKKDKIVWTKTLTKVSGEADTIKDALSEIMTDHQYAFEKVVR